LSSQNRRSPNFNPRKLISVVGGLYPVFDKDAFFQERICVVHGQITVRAQTVSVYINYSSYIRIHDMFVPLYIFVNIVFVLMGRMANWMLE